MIICDAVQLLCVMLTGVYIILTSLYINHTSSCEVSGWYILDCPICSCKINRL